MIEPIDKRHWSSIADVLDWYFFNTPILPKKLEYPGQLKWFVNVIKQPMSFYFDKGIIITKNLVSTLISDDPEHDPTRLEVFYYCIPYNQDAEVEYKTRLTSNFPGKNIVFFNILDDQQSDTQSPEIQSEGDNEPTELGFSSEPATGEFSTTAPTFGLK